MKDKCRDCSRECFSLNPDYEPDDCNGNEEREEAFKRAERSFDFHRVVRDC